MHVCGMHEHMLIAETGPHTGRYPGLHGPWVLILGEAPD